MVHSSIISTLCRVVNNNNDYNNNYNDKKWKTAVEIFRLLDFYNFLFLEVLLIGQTRHSLLYG